jgi:putative transposase
VAGFVASQRAACGIPAAASCRALGVSRSWYDKWAGGQLPPRAARRERLKAEAGRLFALHKGKCGSPRITADLKDAGWKVSKNTIAAVMREMGLAARPKKRRRATTRPGRGAVAGTGPDPAGFPGGEDQLQVVQGRHRDRNR